jgi:hypothetical protein
LSKNTAITSFTCVGAAYILEILFIKYLGRRCLMGNPFVHIELQTVNLEKSKKFYRDLFDWKMDSGLITF